jgi:outer membrane lipoprotein carrier protein
MQFKKAVLIFFLIFFLPSAYALSAAEQLAAQLNTIHTMQADFTQTLYDNRGKAVAYSYGRMAIQRPGKFRWEMIKPIPQLIIANQARLSIYDKDLEQLTVRSLSAAAGETPALLLSHTDVVLERDYQVSISSEQTAGLQWFTLVPKERDNMFAAVELGFANGQIKQMRLQDHLGHNTAIKFSNAQVNKPLTANLFNLKVPANVDVIDETKQK